MRSDASSEISSSRRTNVPLEQTSDKSALAIRILLSLVDESELSLVVTEPVSLAELVCMPVCRRLSLPVSTRHLHSVRVGLARLPQFV